MLPRIQLSDQSRRARRLQANKIIPERCRSAHRLCCQFRKGVAEGLATKRRRFPPGARGLTRRQEHRPVGILPQGAVANGYRTELWTRKRVAEGIQSSLLIHIVVERLDPRLVVRQVPRR